MLSWRYTVLVAPHQLGRCRSFNVTLGGVLGCLALWSGVTLAGFAFFVQGGNLLISLAEAELYKTRVQVLAREVGQMREVAQGLAFLAADLRYLTVRESNPTSANQNAEILTHQVAQAIRPMDTLSRILAGKISQGTLAHLRKEKDFFEKNSSDLRSQATSLLMERYNKISRERAIPADWPAIGALTSRYGMRVSPFHQPDESMDHHRGVDIANAEGTPIRAAAAGIVRYAGWMSGYGRTVILDHGFGYSTLYGHTSKIAISKGQYARAGDIIAYMGTTGRSTGSHLHFEVWQHGRPVNPFKVVQGKGYDALKDSMANVATAPSMIVFPDGRGGPDR